MKTRNLLVIVAAAGLAIAPVASQAGTRPLFTYYHAPNFPTFGPPDQAQNPDNGQGAPEVIKKKITNLLNFLFGRSRGSR